MLSKDSMEMESRVRCKKLTDNAIVDSRFTRHAPEILQTKCIGLITASTKLVEMSDGLTARCVHRRMSNLNLVHYQGYNDA